MFFPRYGQCFEFIGYFKSDSRPKLCSAVKCAGDGRSFNATMLLSVRRVTCDRAPQPRDHCCLPQATHYVCYAITYMHRFRYVIIRGLDPVATLCCGGNFKGLTENKDQKTLKIATIACLSLIAQKQTEMLGNTSLLIVIWVYDNHYNDDSIRRIATAMI